MEKATRRLTLSAMFLALGLVLPFLTGQVPQIGNMLLPMHLPVFLCGLLCGWQYGAAVGFALPLLRSSLFALPVMFPAATAMAFELMTYGLVAGRLVWGVVQSLQLGLSGSGFTMEMFLAGALFNAIPGILLQLVLIPALMVALHRTGLVPFHTARPEGA